MIEFENKKNVEATQKEEKIVNEIPRRNMKNITSKTIVDQRTE